MSDPFVLDESVTVTRPVAQAFAYVSVFSRIEEWDPAVARASSLTAGPPAVGSEFLVEMKLGFSLRYRIEELDPDRRVLMSVESRLFSAREEILFEALSDTETAIRYIASFQFPSSLALANKLYPSAMMKVGKSAMKGLKTALEDEYKPPPMSRAKALADQWILPGIWRFTRLGFRASRKSWKPMSAWLGGQHIIVTGATSGVGQAAATSLALMGASLTLVARNPQKAQAVVDQLYRATGNKEIAVEICDMSLMSDVHALADRLLSTGRPIDALVNNAGALFTQRTETPEGLEQSFALLLLAPYILTERVKPLLASTGNARVVNITSGGMYTQKIRVDDLQSVQGKYAGATAYARAKRGMMIVTEEWASRWHNEGIAVNAMHPGWADTPGVESSLPGFYRLTRPLLRTPHEGADTAVWLAASAEAGKVSGKLWLDREQHPAHLSARTKETPEERQQLLEQLQQLMSETRRASRDEQLQG
jgi:dehydrogenase/reductase SDR family member 12